MVQKQKINFYFGEGDTSVRLCTHARLEKPENKVISKNGCDKGFKMGRFTLILMNKIV